MVILNKQYMCCFSLIVLSSNFQVFDAHLRRKMTLLETKLPQNALRVKRHQKEPEV